MIIFTYVLCCQQPVTWFVQYHILPEGGNCVAALDGPALTKSSSSTKRTRRTGFTKPQPQTTQTRPGTEVKIWPLVTKRCEMSPRCSCLLIEGHIKWQGSPKHLKKGPETHLCLLLALYCAQSLRFVWLLVLTAKDNGIKWALYGDKNIQIYIWEGWIGFWNCDYVGG